MKSSIKISALLSVTLGEIVLPPYGAGSKVSDNLPFVELRDLRMYEHECSQICQMPSPLLFPRHS